jgi:hypothetical protein
MSLVAYILVVAAPGHRLPHALATEDDIGELRRRRIERLPNKAPSTLGEPPEFKKYQRASDGPAFYFNRPPSAAGIIPVTLLHPIFGQFVDDCDTHMPTREDNTLVFALSKAMSEFYDNEDSRATEFRDILAAHGIEMRATRIEGTKYQTDGDIQMEFNRYTIAEVKGEIGSKGAEPLIQVGWYYQESTKKAAQDKGGSCLPCLLIYLFG